MTAKAPRAAARARQRSIARQPTRSVGRIAIAYCGRQPIEAESAAPKIAGATRSLRRRHRSRSAELRGRWIGERRFASPSPEPRARRQCDGEEEKRGLVGHRRRRVDDHRGRQREQERSGDADPDVAADAVEGVGEDQVEEDRGDGGEHDQRQEGVADQQVDRLAQPDQERIAGRMRVVLERGEALDAHAEQPLVELPVGLRHAQ